jgi:solute carrier family 66 (lysosomal lysine-arginine transporter), member 1
VCSSISIACWVVVFSPQIIENFRRGSADGLSLLFLVVWLAGDVFNILGAVLQGVLPTMIILAVYYTLADIVLLGQCFYYRGFTLSDPPVKGRDGDSNAGEQDALLGGPNGNGGTSGNSYGARPAEGTQRRLSFREHLAGAGVDGTHLSPATPLLDASDPPAAQNIRPTSTLQTILFNTVAILLVCLSGLLGWWVSERRSPRSPPSSPSEPSTPSSLSFDLWGQIFGYFCAALYLGSRFPQLLLNWRRKSTEGVSLLFFLFACIGNLTYVMSIFAYSPVCRDPGACEAGEAMSIYGRYILVNLSWILGSFGTLLLDMGIFAQFFLYRVPDDSDDEDESAVVSD